MVFVAIGLSFLAINSLPSFSPALLLHHYLSSSSFLLLRRSTYSLIFRVFPFIFIPSLVIFTVVSMSSSSLSPFIPSFPPHFHPSLHHHPFLFFSTICLSSPTLPLISTFPSSSPSYLSPPTLPSSPSFPFSSPPFPPHLHRHFHVFPTSASGRVKPVSESNKLARPFSSQIHQVTIILTQWRLSEGRSSEVGRKEERGGRGRRKEGILDRSL